MPARLRQTDSPGTHGKGTVCPYHTMSCWPEGEWRARCTAEQGAIANSSKSVMLQVVMSREYSLTGVTLIKTESCLLSRAKSRMRQGKNGAVMKARIVLSPAELESKERT